MEEKLKELKTEQEAVEDGSAYQVILDEARSWYRGHGELQPPCERFPTDMGTHRSWLWKEIKNRFYPRLKQLPQGKGETKPVIDKFLTEVMKNVSGQ